SDGPHLSLRPLTHEGYEALYPRWRDSSTLVYGGDNQKDVPGLYSVSLAGIERRLDRRNDANENEPVADHLVVYDQQDFTSPYDLRTDLYRSDHGHDHR